MSAGPIVFETDELLTAQEVADIVRVHVDTFRRWCRDGAGPKATRFGAGVCPDSLVLVRFARSDVKAWIESRKEAAERDGDE